jgi:digeranylgeranylglycerophospholipid reductase
MRLLSCDVAIVGAGPAGSAAARTAAERGSDVILLEEHRQVGLPNHCAEGLSLNGLKDAGVEPTPDIVSQKITKARVYVPNGKYLELTSTDWVGYTINRDVFDRVMSEMAVDAGAKLMTETKVSEVTREKGAVSGVIAGSGGEELRVEAKVVIGADGFGSTVRNSAGLGRWFPDAVSLVQYRLGSLALEEPEVNEFYIGSKVAPGAYAWVFPKSRSAANVGLGVRRTHAEPTIAYLKRFVESDERFHGARIIETSGGVTPVSGVIDRIVDDGLMLVGDAAGQLIPCTGAGVHTGVVAGKIAGEVAAKAIETGDVSTSSLSEYGERFDAMMGKRIRESRRVVDMLDRFGDEDLNALAEVITSEDVLALANGYDTARVIARIVARSPLKIMRLMAAYMRR